MIRPKGKKFLLIPLLLVVPGVKLLSSGIDFYGLNFRGSGIGQSLKPPVSRGFGLDLNLEDVKKFSASWIMKNLKKENNESFAKYADAPKNTNRGYFINHFCKDEGTAYGLLNLMQYEKNTGNKPSLNGHYTKQLLNLLKTKLNNDYMKILENVIRNWDSTHKINLSDLNKFVDKLKELKKTISKPKTGTYWGRAYELYDAVNISLQIAMAVLFDLVKDRVY